LVFLHSLYGDNKSLPSADVHWIAPRCMSGHGHSDCHLLQGVGVMMRHSDRDGQVRSVIAGGRQLA
jgi:hypothetical protein